MCGLYHMTIPLPGSRSDAPLEGGVGLMIKPDNDAAVKPDNDLRRAMLPSSIEAHSPDGFLASLGMSDVCFAALYSTQQVVFVGYRSQTTGFEIAAHHRKHFASVIRFSCSKSPQPTIMIEFLSSRAGKSIFII